MQPIAGAKHLEATDDNCPVCEAKLDLYSLHGMKFESCPKCGGLWLVKDELRRLKNKVGLGQLHWLNAEVDDLEKTKANISKRNCPKHDGGQLLSVKFGKSSVTVDWCPKCHGIWLDRGELEKVIHYLINELGNASIKDVEKEIGDDFKKLWAGKGPEGRLEEIGDIAAAITAMINFTIFEHPLLFKTLMDVQAAGRGLEID